MNYETRLKQAKSYYAAGLERVKTTPEPAGQKFPIGTRVMIDDDLGPTMNHFPAGVEATVEYVYSHAYGGTDVKSYSLSINGQSSAWYHEHQLTAILASSFQAPKTVL